MFQRPNYNMPKAYPILLQIVFFQTVYAQLLPATTSSLTAACVQFLLPASGQLIKQRHLVFDPPPISGRAMPLEARIPPD